MNAPQSLIDQLQAVTPHFGPFNEAASIAAAAHYFAENYEPALIVVPDADNTAIARNGTYERRVHVPAGSYLWAISASSEEAAGGRLQITDQGTRTPFYSRPVTLANATGSETPHESGPLTIQHLLGEPRLIEMPGLLMVSIQNLASVENTIQVVLFILQPKADNL